MSQSREGQLGFYQKHEIHPRIAKLPSKYLQTTSSSNPPNQTNIVPSSGTTYNQKGKQLKGKRMLSEYTCILSYKRRRTMLKGLLHMAYDTVVSYP